MKSTLNVMAATTTQKKERHVILLDQLVHTWVRVRVRVRVSA